MYIAAHLFAIIIRDIAIIIEGDVVAFCVIRIYISTLQATILVYTGI